VKTKSDKIADLENTKFLDDKNVLIAKVVVDPSDCENHSVVQGDVKITDRLCHKKPTEISENTITHG
jgi:hypothetical protein